MIAPAAIVSRTRLPPPPARIANAITPTPSSAIADADVRACTAQAVPAGSTKPSRSAAIGGTRVAFTAGATDATSAAPRPTASGSEHAPTRAGS